MRRKSGYCDAFEYARDRPSSACATVWAAGWVLGTLRLPGERLTAATSAERSPAAPALDEAVWAVVNTPPSGEAALAWPDLPIAFESVGADAAASDLVDAELPEAVLELPRSVESVWLILINCSRLFTLINWLMYSLGSVVAVGSWFFISVTSKVRKSLAEMVELSVLLVLLASPVPVVGLARGVELDPESAWEAVIA
jgi:hypothetical protein